MVLRRQMMREAAAEAGYHVGLARRQPNHAEKSRWHRAGLKESFDRGLERGRRQRARLEQLTLEGVA